MHALVVRRNGVLEAHTEPVEIQRSGTIRVNVEYAGVGFADVMAVQGGYFLAPPKPFSPGYEFMGTVEATGQRVVGMLPKMGCYQPWIDVDPLWAVPVPDTLSSEVAAAMPLNYLTALALMDAKAQLRPGDSFLIHGAAGGVGSAALELGRAKGLRAFGTVSAGKETFVESLGAIALRRGPQWLQQARQVEPRGFQAAFDSFGGTLLRQSFASLAPGGVLVSYGFSPTSGGGNGPLFDGLLFHAYRRLFPAGRRVAICGTPALVDQNRAWYRESLQALLDHAVKGTLSPRIHAIVAAERVAEAHQMIRAGTVQGKVLLRFSAKEKR